MSVVTITKNRVIKALREEPVLRPGAWVAQVGDQDIYIASLDRVLQQMPKNLKTKDCSVCAVGSVMRSILHPNQSLVKITRASEAATKTRDTIYSVPEWHEIRELKIEGFKKSVLDLYKNNPSFHMAILSQLFEGLCMFKAHKRNSNYPSYQEPDVSLLTGRDIGAIRASLVAFVKKNFPNSIQININGARPAKDVLNFTEKSVVKAKKLKRKNG